jgi:3-phosphoshikimate 1-carboxyvinyltransferase
MEGRLPKRPLSALKEEMERMGCQFSWVSSNELRLTGKLRPGDYHIDGGISSQFITGLLFASSLMDGDSTICITGRLESKPYVDMTLHAMARFGVKAENFHIRGGQQYVTPGEIVVEGDWSNGAFFLAAKQLGSNLTVMQLDENSPQGDRKVAQLLPKLKNFTTIDVSDIPDLVPILSVVASAGQGASFQNIQRLRLKESDRVASTIAMIENLGGKAEATEDTLIVYPSVLRGGTVDAVNDHRIAMAAAIAATVCKEDVTILGAQCVKKSYPQFWEEYSRLGGNYELNLR